MRILTTSALRDTSSVTAKKKTILEVNKNKTVVLIVLKV